jgi:isopenicillin-N N-acyltransferase-like protein
MQAIENEPDELIDTRVRYFRALRLLKSTELHTVKSLQAIQRDHINYPNSICNHAVDMLSPLDREKTVNALVIDLTTRAMHIAWGNPCENQYHTFYLEEDGPAVDRRPRIAADDHSRPVIAESA